MWNTAKDMLHEIWPVVCAPRVRWHNHGSLILCSGSFFQLGHLHWIIYLHGTVEPLGSCCSSHSLETSRRELSPLRFQVKWSLAVFQQRSCSVLLSPYEQNRRIISKRRGSDWDVKVDVILFYSPKLIKPRYTFISCLCCSTARLHPILIQKDCIFFL